jgi:hypothetical protein
MKLKLPRPRTIFYKEDAAMLTVLSLTLLGVLLFVIVAGAFL